MRRWGSSAAATLVLTLLAGSVLLGALRAVAHAAPADPAPVATEIGAPVMLVVDTSGSMGDLDGTGTVKLEGARRALLALIQALPPSSRVGMRTYPGTGGDCGSGQLDVPVGRLDAGSTSARVQALSADGGTPTAEALQAAADDLRFAGYSSATIVLVSDGHSTCDAPCEVAEGLRASGFDVVVNTVGFQIDADGATELQCIADATGGSYHDARDSAALAEELADTQVPDLDVDLTYDPQYSLADAAQLDITAVIDNESDVLAEDVRASLVFDMDASGGSLTVLQPLQPLRVLGNAAGGAKLRVQWQAYLGLVGDDDVGDELRFTVYVSSRYGTPVVQKGAVTIAATGISDAASWMRDVDEVVVLGDSYSAGEGGGEYTDEQEGTGGCHRSPNTYAAQLYAGTDTEVINLACSGAVTADYMHGQGGRTVDPQQDQLGGYGDYDLVMLTMGGNDVHFASIIRNCVTGSGCGGGLRCTIPAYALIDCGGAIRSSPLFWQSQLADLRVGLVAWYRQVLADTRGVPVVVLPYVRPVPDGGTVNTGCSGTTAFGLEFSTRELQLIQWLQAELNRQIALAVQDVDDPRLLFATDVADALQPSHTLCSDDRWIVGLSDRGLPGTATANQELAHPTKDGYAAIARALIRWSTTQNPPSVAGAGGSIVAWFEAGFNAAAMGLASLLGGTPAIDMQNAVDPTSLPAGGSLMVRASGYAPGEQVLVTVRSTSQALASTTADEDGTVQAEVELPDTLLPGEHTLLAQGFGTDGQYVVTGAVLDVGRRTPWGGVALAGIGVVVAVSGVLLLRRGLVREALGR